MTKRITFALVLLVFACPAARAEPGPDADFWDQVLYFGIECVVKPAVKGLAQEMGKQAGSRAAEAVWPSQTDGKVSTGEYNQLLERVKQQDSKHAEDIKKLQGELREKMTREEVRELLLRHLASTNKQLAEVARKVQEQRETLQAHEQILSGFGKDINRLFEGQGQLSKNLETFRDAVNEQFGRQGQRIRRVEEEIVSLREDYPRYKPGEQAEQLGVAGMRFLLKDDFKEALRAFRVAHAYDEGDPCYLYGMALAYRGLKQSEEAELYVARGVAADRKHSLVYSRVWTNMAEKLQTADHSWLEQRRADPQYGVRVPGMIRVPDSLSER